MGRVYARTLRTQAIIVFAPGVRFAQRGVREVHALRELRRPRLRGALLPVRMQQGHEQVVVLLEGLRRCVAGGAQDLVMVRALEEADASNEVLGRLANERVVADAGRDLALREPEDDAALGQRFCALEIARTGAARIGEECLQALGDRGDFEIAALEHGLDLG